MLTSFALLDDCNASAAQPTSRLYTELHQVLECTDSAQFDAMINQAEQALQQGFYAVAVFSYELGAELQGLSRTKTSRCTQPSQIFLYKQCRQLSSIQVGSWLEQQGEQMAGIADLHSSVSRDEFTHAIDRIQRYIADGDSYEVNYTYRLHFRTYGTIFSLYQRLRQRQCVPFGSLISMPDSSAILSLSPELFIRHNQGKLFASPMKGTAAALITGNREADECVNNERAQALSLDEKNRAENVMIVDLLRNDLGRVARPGSVRVTKLFDVQRFNSVLQMTSNIEATCRDDVKLVDLLKAIYPCGSITGAPKIRTMQIIQELETDARGIYTGAIGWFDPTTNSIPEFCLSVPIRTMHLQEPDANEMRLGVMGVGAGIVYDSVADDEYQECELKARFLTKLAPQFSLFETMYATKEDGCRHWERHLHRLVNSAQYFNFPVDIVTLKNQLDQTCAALAANTPYRIKLSLDGLGEFQFQTAVLQPIKTPVKVILAPTPQQSNNPWLQHKTTRRAEYDQAWQTAEKQGAFDMLFCNEQGELTEGGRTNLLVKIDGSWYTPPLSAGVLPGVMRSVLMEDPQWKLTERTIHIDEFANVEQIAVCNALRGVLMVNV